MEGVERSREDTVTPTPHAIITIPVPWVAVLLCCVCYEAVSARTPFAATPSGGVPGTAPRRLPPSPQRALEGLVLLECPVG